MIKVAFLNCHGDDVFCFRREIIEALLRKGCMVILSCPEHHRLDYFRVLENVIIEDIRIDRRGTNPFNDLKLIWDYCRLFKKYRPDIVCSFTIKPNIYGSLAADLTGIPHINNITGIGSGYKNGGLVRHVVTFLYKVALRKSKMVFFQNEENSHVALDSGMIKTSARYKVIPGSGVNLTHFAYKKKIHTGSIVFNYIGRVMKDKGIDVFLEAAVVIRKKHPETIFNIIGFIEESEGHYQEKLADLEKDGIVHYYGSLDDVRPLIYESDAIIHPSTYGEGISNVLLETAACGRACITTGVEGCRDCVDDGVSGYIYRAGDFSQLCYSIERFIALSSDERMRMGMAGRNKVERCFDRNVVVDEYMKEIGII